MQLDKTLKKLQEDNAKLSTRNDQLTRQLENERNKTPCESINSSLQTIQIVYRHVLNASIIAHQECQKNLTKLQGVKTNLEKCQEMNRSLQINQMLHHRVLNANASNIAHQECQKNLTELQEVKTHLEKSCREMNRSLQTNQIIHNRELNASNIAHQECQKNLTELQVVTTQLKKCQQSKKPRLSCKGSKDAGFRTDGNYMIDPDGPGGVDSFEVECLMTGHNGEPVTVMHHKRENKTQVGPNEPSGQYNVVRNVVYQASIPQITAAISISAKCEQFIKLDCYDTPITNTCTWYSRDGTPMYYWGGAAPGSGKCACGMTNSCDKPDKMCNCDANDVTWRSDSGILTDRNTLPVTKMAFGDLDNSIEIIFYTLGPLRCYG